MFAHSRKSAAIGTAALSLALLLTGCGGDSSADPAAQEIELLPEDEALAAQVPEEIRQKGTLVFATDATAPPNQFLAEDGTTIVGNEIDFANQLASILGLEAEFVNTSFDSIIPGLEAGRYDLSISGFRDTKEREEIVDFVTYAKAGPQIFTKAENADQFTTMDQMCGHSFAVQSATVQQAVAEEKSEECEAAGNEPIDIKTFKTQSDQIQAVSSGQVEAGAQNAPNNVYLAEQTDGALVGTGEPFAEGLWGMPIPKDTGLTEPIHGAMEQLIESPQYDEILQKWGVEVQAIDETVINGATS